uniref:Acid phosphatase n=1 Tax=Panagrolaimus sp. JU765 TaxID=591449 RepID=A0AC34RII0_9BILA
MFCNAKELRFVQAIWRHGDRAPSKHPYPYDPYDETYWPTGWSQLTELGAQQLEELGAFFRQRYVDSFVNETFSVYEANRALSSAQAFLDGMFNLNVCGGPRKAPIPIHSTGVDIDDFLLKPTSTDCPAYEKHFERLSAPLLQTTQQNYDVLFNFLGNVTGIGPNITVDQVAGLSNIAREIAHNLTQPDWVQKIWPEYGNATTLDLIKIIDRETRINEFNDDKLAKYRGGYLLGDWLTRTKKVAEGKQKDPSKMMLYSSHDGTLLSLLYSLKIADGEQIPYAASVIMEIYETDVGKFEAQFIYRKNGEVLLKTIPGCTESCPVEQLMEILKDNAVYTRKEAEKLCKVKKAKKLKSSSHSEETDF